MFVFVFYLNQRNLKFVYVHKRDFSNFRKEEKIEIHSNTGYDIIDILNRNTCDYLINKTPSPQKKKLSIFSS